MVRHITITDVVLRDGLQDEPRVTSVDDRRRIAEALVAAGVSDIEAASFVNPSRVPQMAGAEELAAGTLAIPNITWRALALNAKGVVRAVSAGFTDISLVVSASGAHSQANSGRSSSEAINDLADVVAENPGVRFSGGVATAFVCPFEGRIPGSAVVEIAETYAAIGVERVGLADTVGTAEPAAVEATLQQLRSSLPAVDLSLHLHNAQGQAFETVDRALDMGITQFDAATGGYGGCPFAPGAHGNIATEDLVAHLHKRGFDTGIDLDGLGRVGELITSALVRGKPVAV